MADTLNYNIEKPDEGADLDTWGGILNAGLDAIDVQMKVNDDAAVAAAAATVLTNDGLVALSVDVVANIGDIATNTAAIAANIIPQATVTEIRASAADKYVTAANATLAADYVTLTSTGGLTAVDFALANNFVLATTENTVIQNPTNAAVGMSGIIKVDHDTTTAYTIGFGTDFVFANKTAPVFTAILGATDVLAYTVISGGKIIVTLIPDVG